jgi:hypothetical protein
VKGLLDDGFRTPPGIYQQCQRLFGAASTWTSVGEKKALEYVFRGCLAPYAVASQQEEVLAHIGDDKLEPDIVEAIRRVLA